MPLFGEHVLAGTVHALAPTIRCRYAQTAFARARHFRRDHTRSAHDALPH
ncbi:hypothetical protein [Streptomyces sp. NPDC096012]